MGVNKWYAPIKGYPTFITDIGTDFVHYGNGGDVAADFQNNFIIEALRDGSAVVEIGVVEDSEDNLVSNTVTVDLFVLPTVPGAQEPTLTQDEIKGIASYNSTRGNHKEGWITVGGGHF